MVGEGRKEKKWCFLEESTIVTPVVTELKFHINESVRNVQGKGINVGRIESELGRSHNLVEDRQKE